MGAGLTEKTVEGVVEPSELLLEVMEEVDEVEIETVVLRLESGGVPEAQEEGESVKGLVRVAPLKVAKFEGEALNLLDREVVPQEESV